mgnify:FL=1
MSRVLVMMSGGVDSSVAAALLRDAGHEVVGVTLKLWGGDSDSGCCSIRDVDDARRVADRLGIDHHTFNFTDDFTRHVVEPYAAAHAAGDTPNPCIECNRHLKFQSVWERARRLGFDAVATGHHARIVEVDGRHRLARGADRAKDQSYVLHMLDQDQLAATLLPIGAMQKAEVRALAARLDLRTATKADSQDVCFITRRAGRGAFLGERIPLTPATVVDRTGAPVGRVDAVELVTYGQRKGLGLAGGTDPRYVVDIDRRAATATVTVGDRRDLLVDGETVGAPTWSDPGLARLAERRARVIVQTSAHGEPAPATLGRAGDEAGDGDGSGGAAVTITWDEPRRRVAPGQSVAFYDGDLVLGGGTVVRAGRPADPA